MIFYSPPQKFGGGNDKQTTSQTPPNTSKSLPDASPEKPEIAYKPPTFQTGRFIRPFKGKKGKEIVYSDFSCFFSKLLGLVSSIFSHLAPFWRHFGLENRIQHPEIS